MSITRKIKIANTENPAAPFEVEIQRDKNGSICNITNDIYSCAEILNKFRGQPFGSQAVQEELLTSLYCFFNG